MSGQILPRYKKNVADLTSLKDVIQILEKFDVQQLVDSYYKIKPEANSNFKNTMKELLEVYKNTEHKKLKEHFTKMLHDLKKLLKKVAALRKGFMCSLCNHHNHVFFNGEENQMTYSKHFCQKLISMGIAALKVKYVDVLKHFVTLAKILTMMLEKDLFNKNDLKYYEVMIPDVELCEKKNDFKNCERLCAEFNINAFSLLWDAEAKPVVDFVTNFKKYIELLKTTEGRKKHFKYTHKKWKKEGEEDEPKKPAVKTKDKNEDSGKSTGSSTSSKQKASSSGTGSKQSSSSGSSHSHHNSKHSSGSKNHSTTTSSSSSSKNSTGSRTTSSTGSKTTSSSGSKHSHNNHSNNNSSSKQSRILSETKSSSSGSSSNSNASSGKDSKDKKPSKQVKDNKAPATGDEAEKKTDETKLSKEGRAKVKESSFEKQTKAQSIEDYLTKHPAPEHKAVDGVEDDEGDKLHPMVPEPIYVSKMKIVFSEKGLDLYHDLKDNRLADDIMSLLKDLYPSKKKVKKTSDAINPDVQEILEKMDIYTIKDFINNVNLSFKKLGPKKKEVKKEKVPDTLLGLEFPQDNANGNGGDANDNGDTSSGGNTDTGTPAPEKPAQQADGTA